ncbi:MAG: molecular chaperone DnaJ [Anaerolineae bacterium]|nr:molecular chaperone DnaJ [Anaerolineae bacterium]
MPTKRDYYEILGVRRDANQEEIKKSFRRKARQYHPDVNQDPNAATLFKEANEAYDVLSDPQKRATYDRFGHAAVGGAGAGDPFGGFTDISDIFDEFFGTGFRSSRASSRRGPRKGQDLQYRLTIEFEEAIFGAEREIEFERTATCGSCNGSGAEPGTTPVRCSTCGGTGEIRNVRQTFLGQMVNINTCPTCQGSGEMVSSPCQECKGKGQVRQTRHLTVSIPAGVDHGTQIRISGEGEPGTRGGPAGNLYIVLSVRSHEYFRRREHDLFIKLQINVAQAALGHQLLVPILTSMGESTADLDIPPGTQSGQILILKGKGVPRLRRDGTHAGYGDMQIMIEVEVPSRLTAEQRTLFEKLGATLGEAIIPPANEKGFFERVLDWLGGE